MKRLLTGRDDAAARRPMGAPIVGETALVRQLHHVADVSFSQSVHPQRLGEQVPADTGSSKVTHGFFENGSRRVDR